MCIPSLLLLLLLFVVDGGATPVIAAQQQRERTVTPPRRVGTGVWRSTPRIAQPSSVHTNRREPIDAASAGCLGGATGPCNSRTDAHLVHAKQHPSRADSAAALPLPCPSPFLSLLACSSAAGDAVPVVSLRVTATRSSAPPATAVSAAPALRVAPGQAIHRPTLLRLHPRLSLRRCACSRSDLLDRFRVHQLPTLFSLRCPRARRCHPCARPDRPSFRTPAP